MAILIDRLAGQPASRPDWLVCLVCASYDSQRELSGPPRYAFSSRILRSSRARLLHPVHNVTQLWRPARAFPRRPPSPPRASRSASRMIRTLKFCERRSEQEPLLFHVAEVDTRAGDVRPAPRDPSSFLIFEQAALGGGCYRRARRVALLGLVFVDTIYFCQGTPRWLQEGLKRG